MKYDKSEVFRYAQSLRQQYPNITKEEMKPLLQAKFFAGEDLRKALGPFSSMGVVHLALPLLLAVAKLAIQLYLSSQSAPATDDTNSWIDEALSNLFS